MAHLKKEDTRLTEILQTSSLAGEDAIRELVRHTIQQVLEEEMTAFLNAEPYDRTEERRGYRNGYKSRVLKTRVGRLELLVSQDREGQFRTEFFEKYQRSEKALVLEISKSQVSALAKGLDAEIAAWRKRPLEAIDTRVPTHPKAAAMLDLHGEEMLAVYALPVHHQLRMRTTNMIERFNKESGGGRE